MIKKVFFLIVLFTSNQLDAQSNILNQIITNTQNITENFSEEEVTKGLKEALQVASNIAVSNASKTNGFYKNNLIKIPFPEDAIQVKKVLKKAGLESKINEFEISLNRAAEDASKVALEIFINQIKNLTLNDVYSILKGSNTEATDYLKENTYDKLYNSFFPIVKNSINKVDLTKKWEALMKHYNKIPLVKKVNPDLNAHVTLKAIEGLFILTAIEEEKIRNKVEYRTTELLQKIFQ